MRWHTRGSKEKRGLVAVGKGEQVPVEVACKSVPVVSTKPSLEIAYLAHDSMASCRVPNANWTESKSALISSISEVIPDFALGDPGQRRERDAGENLGGHGASMLTREGIAENRKSGLLRRMCWGPRAKAPKMDAGRSLGDGIPGETGKSSFNFAFQTVPQIHM